MLGLFFASWFCDLGQHALGGKRRKPIEPQRKEKF